MERRRRSEREATSPPPPPPTPSTCLRDVSNYKTPRPHFPNPNPDLQSPLPLFFTASKKTPFSSSAAATSRRRLSAAPTSSSKAARRLKALELDQSRSSRKVQIRRERALKSFSRSLSAWLNFLFKNPTTCGCNVGVGAASQPEVPHPSANGKRESLDGVEIGVCRRWRSPKRQRRSRKPSADGVERLPSSSSVLSLGVSLQEVCSLEDLNERLEVYMSRKSCDEVLLMMSQVCKNIDEGRLKMKAHCPIVTDLRLKEKATKVLMCYNPVWLRIGLHMVLGGDSLLMNEGQSDQEDLFLKVIVERQFFSHMDLAKSYAYNKLVEGLYRPGYFEALGNIILKRFLLLVISLDKAKCESTLPIKYGIDGLDGGSPLLFGYQSSLKSSRQVIHEFLSEVMHGEGDLLAHLVIMGCKVNYQQAPLAEYDFTVSNLSEDLQDGILLCRALQLLLCDASILSKVIAPSDTRKKNLQNSSIAIQYLKQAGVLLSDGDGVLIVADDVANGDKELTLSILWNMFLHLQVPLLIEKTSLVEEIIRMKDSDMDLSKYNTMTHMALLLEWIQIACERYHVKVDSFCSMMDGKVFHYLINYYVGNEEIQAVYNEDLIKLHDNDHKIEVHGFVLAQSVIAMLGSFPEILSLSDILDQDASCDERSVIILLVFLASQLIRRKNLDKLIALRVTRTNYQSQDMNFSAAPSLQLSRNAMFNHKSRGRSCLKLVSILKEERIYNYRTEEWAATVIQSRFRGFTERNKFLKIKIATSFLQTVTRAWLAAASKSRSNNVNVSCSLRQPSLDIYERYLMFMIKRNSFVKLKKSVLLIQWWVRTWLKQRHENDYVNAVTNLQSYIRGHIGRSRYLLLAQLHKQSASFDELEILECQSRASIKIQLAWGSFNKRKFHLQKRFAATKIQSHWRGWYTRKKFFHQVSAIINIQACIRCLLCQKSLKRCRWAVVEIQRLIRGQVARNRMLGYSYLRSGRPPFVYYSMLNTHQIKNFELRVVMRSVLTLQRWWKQVLLYKSRTMSTVLIQSFIRGFSARKAARKKRDSILTIQRWWRKILFIKSRERSVLTIQSRIRGWIARRSARRDKHHIVVIQSYWKGWLVRKAAKQQVLDLRHRLEKSAANVNDDMRLINRLVAALSELLGCRSISNIRHTCATLNIATEHSQICCETLVAAGAIKILLKQFQYLNRGIPDQEVSKHVLCTLRNIVCYPHLVLVLINTPQSVEIIFQELLRNKCDGFFIACELLRKLCATPEGFESISRLRGHIKRLNNLAQDLERKTELQKRNVRLGAVRDATMRRLKEVVNLLKLMGDDRGRHVQSYAQILREFRSP